jgi:serine/threonine protein kinase
MPRTKENKNNLSKDNNKNTLPVSNGSDSEAEVVDEEIMPINEEIIFPGLILGKNYVLLKKIGSGNNASVWMTYRISTKSYYAIKIQDYQCYHDGCREVAIIKKINKYCNENQNKNIYCVKMLDYFVYAEDDETKYVCSVYDLFAGSIQMVLNEGKHKYGLPIPVVKRIARQLLTALSTMHGELKIIHTDIKPENILFKGMPEYQLEIINLFTKSNFQDKYDKLCVMCASDQEKFGQELEFLAMDSVKEICSLDTEIDNDEEFIPDDEDIDDEFIEGEEDDDDYNSEDEDDKSNLYNERKQSVDDIIEHLDYSDIHDLEKEAEYDFVTILNNRPNTTDKKEVIDDMYVTNCETALTDFGNSYFFEKRTRNEIQDRRYRAPEVILDLNYGYASDIWSIACVVFELLTGFVLFEPDDFPLNKDIHHLFLMEKTLGPIPLVMKKTSKRNKFLFDKKRGYHIKNIETFDTAPLEERLVKQFLFSEQDAYDITDFLMCGLQYNPSDRMSAKEMLNHFWLK